MGSRALLKETFVILAAAVIVALVANYLSPRGIDHFGRWDPSQGPASVRSEPGGGGMFGVIADAEAAKTIFDRHEAIFVDARPAEIYAKGHIKGAVSLPADGFAERIPLFREIYPLTTPVVAYCSGEHCTDSHRLAQLFFLEGYENIRIFTGGYPAWVERGYPSG